jgi:hypothetical protein
MQYLQVRGDVVEGKELKEIPEDKCLHSAQYKGDMVTSDKWEAEMGFLWTQAQTSSAEQTGHPD